MLLCARPEGSGTFYPDQHVSLRASPLLFKHHCTASYLAARLTTHEALSATCLLSPGQPGGTWVALALPHWLRGLGTGLTLPCPLLLGAGRRGLNCWEGTAGLGAVTPGDSEKSPFVPPDLAINTTTVQIILRL